MDRSIPRFGRARRDPSLAVLEGFHPLKHALRFGANVLEVRLPRPRRAGSAGRRARPRSRAAPARARAPGRAGRCSTSSRRCAQHRRDGAGRAPARRPRRACSPTGAPSPVVLLEDPRDLGNMGACVRVAAAADVAGVLTTGSHDPWHPDALRGAAGLHYAVPVCRLERPGGARARCDRPLLAMDPGRRAARPRRAARARGARLRHRAPRPQRRAHRAGGRARQHPHARGGLEPQPRDLRGRRAVRVAPVLARRAGLSACALQRQLGPRVLRYPVQQAPVAAQRAPRAHHHPVGRLARGRPTPAISSAISSRGLVGRARRRAARAA